MADRDELKDAVERWLNDLGVYLSDRALNEIVGSLPYYFDGGRRCSRRIAIIEEIPDIRSSYHSLGRYEQRWLTPDLGDDRAVVAERLKAFRIVTPDPEEA